MRPWTAVLILTLALFVPPASYGRGGGNHSRGSRSNGSGLSSPESSGSSTKSVHVRSYTRKDGTVVQNYDRSAPGTSSGKSRSTKSSASRSLADDDAFAPLLAPKGSTVSRSAITPTFSQSGSSSTSPAIQTSPQSTTPTTGGNQTTQTPTIQFVNGFPFPFGVPWTSYADPETAARRQYGPLVANARNLIRAGVYSPAAQLLQRVIAGAPGTRIAGDAQRLLASIPQ